MGWPMGVQFPHAVCEFIFKGDDMKINVRANWRGLDVEGVVVFGDAMGCSEVGWRELPPYVYEWMVNTPDGDEISCYLDADAEREIENLLVEDVYAQDLEGLI